MNRARRRVALGSAVAILLVLPRLDELLTVPYDSWTHVFFASHYLHGWFSAIDTRWYLGFPVTGYPPLAHQLLALGAVPFLQFGWEQSRALGTSYALLATVLTGLYPPATYLYGRVLTSARAASYGALVGAVFGGWWLILLGYGQLPTALAGVLTLVGGWALSRALRTERPAHVGLVVLLTALVPMTHHFTAISFLPGVYAVVFATHAAERLRAMDDPWAAPRATAVTVLRPAAAIGAAAVALALLALLPFADFLLTGPDQPVIPHGSRQSWLVGAVWSRPQFALTLATGTLFLLLVPVCAYVVDRRADRRSATGLRAAMGVAAVGGALSLGFTTPLPRLLYPGLAESLTYFRFGAWGGFVLLPVVGFVIVQLRETRVADRLDRERLDWAPVVAAAILLILASQVLVASQMATEASASPDRRAEAAQIGEFMETDEHWKWRYLTLGMSQELGLIGVEAPHARTIDGNYNAGRRPDRVPVLARSGAAQLSSAKFSPEGRRVLAHYLAEHEAYGLKFVFSADRAYAGQLRAAGYAVLYEWPWLDVRVWFDPDVPPVYTEPGDPAQGGGPWLYPWGIVPLASLVAAGGCAWRLSRPAGTSSGSWSADGHA
ncbi:hypothetical protein [Haloplanus pelagicus]|uniref:hypothetical protein n=1 Tax=Haloplanus pelagicus TaxID=2949995 RepID=UPI00203D40A3|nr:hypothetical protein [Haloplanus sp. HW8-1]